MASLVNQLAGLGLGLEELPISHIQGTMSLSE